MSNPRDRILVAMSGGVDSSVAAAWLLEQGWEVIGVTLHLWDYPDDGSVRGRCCAPEDQHDARRVSDRLGIPHYTFDRRELFAREVVRPFVDAYLEGTTPSPCVACNRSVKMSELFALADRLGATKVATGHYARIVEENGRLELHRGRDPSKDQSYFLHSLTQAELGRMVFPLGEAVKEEVREDALRRKLHGSEKGESQELCFVPTGRYDAFVEEHAPDRIRPGPILDDSGREIGQHGGIHRFTVGQRKGLGVSLGKPAFVVDIDATSNAIRLGSREGLEHRGARLRDAHFFDDIQLPSRALVQIRYRHEPAPATLSRDDSGDISVIFDEPVRAVVRGQVAVAYQGERVIGGGAIVEAIA